MPNLVYISWQGVSSFGKGAWWPASAVLACPFIFIRSLLSRSARPQVNWRAALATALFFEVLMIYAEHLSLMRGHWIYNEARIFGLKIWGVPIEEPMIYYWLGPIFTITLWGAIRHRLERKPNAQREENS